MTMAPERPALRVGDLGAALAALRGAGFRVTAARRLVLETLFAAEGPVSAGYIAIGLGGGMVPSDLPSTYRNLETFEALGLVRHLHLGHGPGLYVLAGDQYEYLTCERCGRVTKVGSAELDPVRDRIRDAFGYEMRFGHFPMVGLCADCAAQRRSGRPRAQLSPGGEMETEDHAHEHLHTHEPEHGNITPATRAQATSTSTSTATVITCTAIRTLTGQGTSAIIR